MVAEEECSHWFGCCWLLLVVVGCCWLQKKNVLIGLVIGGESGVEGRQLFVAEGEGRTAEQQAAVTGEEREQRTRPTGDVHATIQVYQPAEKTAGKKTTQHNFFSFTFMQTRDMYPTFHSQQYMG